MYGAKYVGNIFSPQVPTLRHFLIKAAEVITKGDFLTFDDTTGKVDVAAADEPLLGIASETITGNSGGTNKVEVQPCRPGDLYLMDNDNTTETFAQTDVGEWHAITGTTGAQQIDTNADSAAPSSSAGQLVCLEYNPQGYEGGIYDSDTSIGLYTPTYTYFTTSYTA